MTTRRALVCALMPEFDRDSGSRRILHFVECLVESGWQVTFVSHHPKPGTRYVRALEQRGIEVYADSKKWIDPLTAGGLFDLAVLGLWDIAEMYLPRIRRRSPRTRIVVDSIDLHFLRTARQIFGGHGEAAGNALDADYASKMMRELNTYAAADAVLAVSEKEAALINDLVADPRLAWAVPDGEDLAPSTVPLAERRGAVFVGCYRFAPNATAVEYMCRSVLPLMDPQLLAAHPMYFVGDGLSESLRALGDGLPGVRMVGWVPSVAPYLERTRISVVPLLYGAGTKRKVLQALMHGSPTVSTSIGIEGLQLRHEDHVLVADDPLAFAKSMTRLLKDDELWRHMEREGRTHMTAARSRDAARRHALRAIEAVFARVPKVAPPDATVAPSDPVAFDPSRYPELVKGIREAVQGAVPPSASVLVVSKGDRALIDLQGRRASHFPQTSSGEYAGFHPSNSEEAIAQLEALQRSEARYLLFPATTLWWLEHYPKFKEHLDEQYTLVVDRPDTCVVYAPRHAAPATNDGLESIVVAPAPVGSDAPRSAVAGTVRLLAFFLPQFHPIPENDRWWSRGFTEWTNVVKARPLFPQHEQPRLAADLGFYDLRLPEVRRAQAELARAHGIHGFCYYHYWFGGKRLLERPFTEVLESGEPDFPFCLCWANEPWSRRWDGRPKDILQPQMYSPEDDVAHIRALIPALTDRRAITINGKPAFLVYQANDLPDAARTTDTWRETLLKEGLRTGIYLIACETGWDAGWDATRVGFDAKLQFQPQFAILFGSGAQIPVEGANGLRVFDYQRAWPVLAKPQPVSYRRYDTVFPRWDNSARVGERGVVLHNSTPEAYQQWLQYAITRVQDYPADERLVFINAWNEWGEGCYLEPDLTHGRAYLEATRRAVATTLPLQSGTATT